MQLEAKLDAVGVIQETRVILKPPIKFTDDSPATNGRLDLEKRVQELGGIAKLFENNTKLARVNRFMRDTVAEVEKIKETIPQTADQRQNIEHFEEIERNMEEARQKIKSNERGLILSVPQALRRSHVLTMLELPLGMFLLALSLAIKAPRIQEFTVLRKSKQTHWSASLKKSY